MRALIVLVFCFLVSLPCLAMPWPQQQLGGQCCEKCGPNCKCDKCECDKQQVGQLGKPLEWQRSLVEGKPREGFFGGVLDFLASAGSFFLGTLNFYRAFATWLNFAWVLPASIFCGFVANGLLIAHAIKGAKS